MKELKRINFIIPLIIYPFDVMISFNENYDQFANAVVKKWGSEILDDFNKCPKANSVGLTYVFTSEKCLCCILKINGLKKDANGIGTIAHEVFHAADFVLEKCGLQLNRNSYEAFAYFVGYLMQEIYKKIQHQ